MASREIEITRILEAPRTQVFDAWTKPAKFAGWWGPSGFNTPRSSVSLDATPGGKWAATIVSDEDGMKVPMAGVYRVVDKPDKLVYTLADVTDEAGPAQAPEVVTVTFADYGKNGRTQMKFHQSGSLDEQQLAEATDGWASFFDRLADFVKKS
jgi:uncharacterized protein YndB with AHSA1/START domain